MYSVSGGRIAALLPNLPSALSNVLCQEDIINGGKMQTRLTVVMDISVKRTLFCHYDNRINVFCLVQKDVRIFD